MPSTRSIPLNCTSKIRSIVLGESSRTPSTSPPQATADWRRARERALPWPLPAPMSARRQPSVQVVSALMVGLVEFAAVDQHERGERGHALGGGEHVGDRVLGPRYGAGL